MELRSMARVLVIDDDRDIREVLVSMLETEGYETGSAPDGLAGLAAARERRPDLILLDLMMPVMDGWTFLTVKLEDSALAGIPVVVLSAAKSLPADGAVQCLQKPCAVEQLLDTVERHRLGGRDRQRPSDERSG